MEKFFSLPLESKQGLKTAQTTLSEQKSNSIESTQAKKEILFSFAQTNNHMFKKNRAPVSKQSSVGGNTLMTSTQDTTALDQSQIISNIILQYSDLFQKDNQINPQLLSQLYEEISTNLDFFQSCSSQE